MAALYEREYARAPTARMVAGRFDATPTVFVVDGDPSVRESLRSLVESAGCRAETFGSGMKFLERPLVQGPSCLVLDVALPDCNGCDVQAAVADRIDMPVIFVTARGDVPTTVRAMRAGAADFLTKPLVETIFLGAVRAAIDRSRAALSDAQRLRALRQRYASLSRRQREVMALVVTGRLNKQVAAALGISEVTVKLHRGCAMSRMGAESFADLVKMAADLGIGSRGSGSEVMSGLLNTEASALSKARLPRDS